MAVLQMQRINICALKKKQESHPGTSAGAGSYGN